MKYLLDTHTLLWFLNGDKQLASNPLRIIRRWENNCCTSIASIWEIAIKISLKKLELKIDFKSFARVLAENKIEVLPLNFVQLQLLLTLKNHHKDPLDRIIITQAIAEDLVVIIKDEVFEMYKIKTLWK